MALQDITDSIEALLVALTNMGQIHDHDRIAVEPAQVEGIFGFTDTTYTKGWSVRAWLIDRTGTEETWETNQEVLRRHTMRIQAYWEVSDANNTRTAFRDKVEEVVTALRGTFQLGANAELIGPPQIENDGLSILGEAYLAHSCDITVVAQERVTF